MVPFLIRSLGEAAYGVWILIGSVFGYTMMLQMGLSSAINRYIPVFLARSDVEGMRKTVSSATFFLSGVTACLLLLTAVFYRYVGVWFANSIPTALVGQAQALIVIVGLCFAVVTILQPYPAVISGLQRYDVHSLSRTLPLLARVGLLVWLLWAGYGLLTVGLIHGLTEVAVVVLMLLFTKRLLKERLVSFAAIDLRFLRDMLFYGFNTFLYLTGALIVFKASDIIIGIFLTAEDITKFSVPTSALLMLSLLMQALTAAIKPAVSDLDARDDAGRVRDIAFLGQKYSLLILIPACSFFIIMGRELLSVWIGPAYGGLWGILALLTVGHFLRLANYSSFLVLVGKGDHKVFGVLTLVMAVCCVVLAVISITVFRAGLLGMAVANAVPMAIISGWALPAYFNRKMGITTKENIAHIWWPAIRGCWPAVTALGLWEYLRPPSTWAGILAVVVVTGTIALAGSWCWALSDLERERFRRVLPIRRTA